MLAEEDRSYDGRILLVETKRNTGGWQIHAYNKKFSFTMVTKKISNLLFLKMGLRGLR